MADYSDYTDQRLVSLIQRHDEHAFAEIYSRYWALLFGVAWKFTRDRDISMDIVQDIYTDFWAHPSRLKHQTSLKAYLYTTVRNLITITTIWLGWKGITSCNDIHVIGMYWRQSQSRHGATRWRSPTTSIRHQWLVPGRLCDWYLLPWFSHWGF